MSANRILSLVYMVLVAPMVMAESAYEINGLNSRMTFTEVLDQCQGTGWRL